MLPGGGLKSSGEAQLIGGMVQSTGVIYRQMELMIQFLVHSGVGVARANAPRDTGYLLSTIGGQAEARKGYMEAAAPYALFPEFSITSEGQGSTESVYFYKAYHRAVALLTTGLMVASAAKIVGAMAGGGVSK
jgi:hypothetical protein